jgi:outer membrane protein assembly factor BamA
MRKISLILILCALPFVGQAQKANSLYFHLDKITVKKKVIKDSTFNYQRYFDKIVADFMFQGYTGVELKDSLTKSNGDHYYFSYTNKFSKINYINANSKKENIKRTADFVGLSRGINEEIKHLENKGFPFAQINIIKQTETKKDLTLTFEIDSGNFYSINEIIIKSEDNFHKKTILNLIGLNEGDVYSESKIANIPLLLSASKLYDLAQPVQLLFKEQTADVYIFLKKKKSSSADGYVGFQQDQITNKLTLNGYINLQLYNAFNRAEIIDMHWKSNPDKTQNFHALIEYPYLFNTPLGVGAKLELRKQDSTFLRSDITLNLSYNHPIAKFTVFDQIESSTTLRESAPAIYRNYAKNTIGATAWLKPPNINALPFYHPELYLLGGFYNYRQDTIDDNKQKISNSKYQIRYAHKIDFLKFFHLNNSIQFEGLTSNIDLSRNELVYFGGLNSIRGFYELELSGNNIWSLRNEIEFKPVDLISILALYDYSTYEYQGRHHTNSFGFGFGLNANGTTLQIIIANGVLDQNPVDFSNTKIHLGFKSVF